MLQLFHHEQDSHVHPRRRPHRHSLPAFSREPSAYSAGQISRGRAQPFSTFWMPHGPRPLILGSRTSRNQSPTKLIPSTASMIAKPGNMGNHHAVSI